MKPILNGLAYLYLAAVYIFVMAPSVVIVVGSFNSATTFPSAFESATLQWYVAIVHYREFIDAMTTSAVLAVLAASIAMVIGFPAAYGLVRLPVPGKDFLAAVFLAPVVVPQIVIGLAVLHMVSVFGLQLSFAGLVVVHAVFVMPFVLRAIMTSLARFDFGLVEAAQSLGGNRLQTLWYVTLPLIRPGVTAGLLFATVLSFVNLPLSLFLTTPATRTLPIQMFAYMESRLDPLVAAVGAGIIVVVFVASFVIERAFKLRLLG